jgi:tetratricopeptide (TPR) repeat protein/predicted Ser/Thr protein kinase
MLVHTIDSKVGLCYIFNIEKGLGKKIGHYEISQLLGKGGMGEVYLAHDTVLDRRVAIKFLTEETEGDPRARERFLREAKAAACLDHPFICQIHETGESEGRAYIVMEYVEGVTLSEKMAAGKIPLKVALQTVLEVAEALEIAHGRGIVHRDLKPANIIMTPQGHAKVMDFGLAKRIQPHGNALTQTLTQPITGEGVIAGTVAYMSPEQACGAAVDGRSDIFSLGIILQEMVAGKHPFSKPTPMETLTSVMRDAPPPVRVIPKSADAPISQILEEALAKDPGQRYQKISDLALDIRKLQGHLAGGGLGFRRWAWAAGSVLLAAGLFIGLWRFILRPGKEAFQPVPNPISVLVADFQNHTGDSSFDGALEQSMGISLEGAPYITVYKHARAHAIAKTLSPSPDDRLDMKQALLVSRREGINAVVEASINSHGTGYAIDVRVLDPATSEELAKASQAIKTKAEVIQATHDLAIKIGSELGAIPPESLKVLSQETFSTSSLEAMQAYSRGQELAIQNKYDEAIKEYLRAIASDPDMGRAYAGMAVSCLNINRFAEAEKYFQMAMSRIDQMTEREKFRTSGGYYLFRQDYQKAIEQYNSLIQKYPGDNAGYGNLAFAYFGARKMAEAMEAAEKAAALTPQDLITYYNLGWYALAAGHFERAKDAELIVIKDNPQDEEAHIVLGLIELASGRTGEAVDSYKKLASLGPSAAARATAGLADLAVYEGRLADAKEILGNGIAQDLKSGQLYLAADKLLILGEAFLGQKQRAKALDCADKALAQSRAEDIQFAAARIYIRAGAENKAKAIAEALGKKVQAINQAYAKLLSGEMSLDKGEATDAARLFREAQSLVDTWLGRFLLGRAFLEAGAYAEAYSEFELCLNRRGEAASILMNDLPSYRYFPPVHYFLGRAQQGLGSPAASESFRQYLKIKEKGDAGDPLVDDARVRLAQLR